MTPKEIKSALMKMNEDCWHKQDLEAAYEIYANDVVFQRLPFPPVTGKAANMEADRGTLSAFTNICSMVDEIIVEGETAVFRWTWEADHTATLPSLGLPATEKHVSFSGCSFYRFKDSKIVEQWEYGDLLGFLQQLGVVPQLG